MNSPLKWHGGKHYLAPRLVEIMLALPHHHYVEPFFGGGSVLLARPATGFSEVANDLHHQLTNFWQVLQDETLFQCFQRHVEAVPFSQYEWEKARDISVHWPRWQQAAAFFVLCRQSLAGRMDCFAPLSKTRLRRNMNEQASAWLTSIEGLPLVHRRLQGVVITTLPAPDVIAREDSPHTLFYCDPPYVHETRATTGEYGAHEMSEEDHRKLLELLLGVRGRVVLSGYRHPLYDDLLSAWKRVDVELPNNAAGGSVKRRMTESIWIKP